MWIGTCSARQVIEGGGYQVTKECGHDTVCAVVCVCVCACESVSLSVFACTMLTLDKRTLLSQKYW